MPDEQPSLSDLFDRVRDRESFIAYARALAEERTRADELVKSRPVYYSLGGALDWQNDDIASFIYAGLAYFEPGPDRFVGEHPSWKDLAEFLFCGKIME